MQAMRHLVCVFVLGIFAGCSDDPPSMPSVDDVVGTYKLDKESEAFLREKRGYVVIRPSLLQLDRNGTAAASSIPDVYLDPFIKASGHSVSGVGRWNLDKTSFGYGITLEIFPGASMPAGIYHGSSIHLRGRRPPYRIEMVLGDPDSGETLTYDRN